MAKKASIKKPGAGKGLVKTPSVPGELLSELRQLISHTREGVTQAVNSALVLLYWQVEFALQHI